MKRSLFVVVKANTAAPPVTTCTTSTSTAAPSAPSAVAVAVHVPPLLGVGSAVLLTAAAVEVFLPPIPKSTRRREKIKQTETN